MSTKGTTHALTPSGAHYHGSALSAPHGVTTAHGAMVALCHTPGVRLVEWSEALQKFTEVVTKVLP